MFYSDDNMKAWQENGKHCLPYCHAEVKDHEIGGKPYDW